MLPALLWRDELLHPVSKEDYTDLVVVLYCSECNRCSNLCDHIAFCLSYSSEIETLREVNDKHHRQFALLLKDLDVWLVETCSHVPVDVTHIVAILVLTHLAEGHTTPLEGRMVLSCKDVVREAARLYLNLANFLYEITCLHESGIRALQRCSE